MSKRIVLCTDGTWDGTGNNTNVYKIYKALTTTSDQIALYDVGVGADGLPLERLVGGAFGTGLWQKIKDGYTQIAHVYEQDDQIFLFGFSRGAYTARSIAGMIAVCGLPTQNFSSDLVETAFQAYRNKDRRAALLATLADCGMYDAKITMVGVWDTVGSLGIPSLFGGVSPLLYGFLDTSLHPDVLHAYHAVAIDERRCEFPATLWTGQPAPAQTVEQVWFVGVHSDVGGGYGPDPGSSSALSDITLSWMMDKASALGLQLMPAVAAQYKAPLDPKYALDTLHNSWNPLWAFPRTRSIDPTATLSNSVVLRCLTDDGYRPKNVLLSDGAPQDSYRIAGVVGQPAVAAAAAGGNG
jgi:uncharacterized protein (DUF2235 family)